MTRARESRPRFAAPAPHPALLLLAALWLAPAAAATEGPERPTGWAVQGLPLLNYNSDQGFGYGLQVMAVDRADGTWTPYRSSFVVQYFATTADIFSHKAAVDLPGFLGSPWRVGLELQYSRNKYNPYYGTGNTSEYVPAYSSCADRDALAADPNVCPGNPDFRGLRYYSYELSGMPRALLNVRRDLSGPWKLFLGYRLRFERVRLRYTADELGQLGDSRLVEDAIAGRLPGIDGLATEAVSQRTSELTTGIQYDTRDVEASPSEGMFHELAVRGASRVLGSEFDYWGATLHARGWWPLFAEEWKLVAALRGVFDVMGGDVPLSLLPYYGGLEGREAVGGTTSARGLLRNRYQGPVKLLLNGELRWSPLTVHPLGQRFDLGLVGFVDTGRVWSDLHFQDDGGAKASGGGGLRVVWNQVFVVRADYGLGITEPTSGFYLELGHIF